MSQVRPTWKFGLTQHHRTQAYLAFPSGVTRFARRCLRSRGRSTSRSRRNGASSGTTGLPATPWLPCLLTPGHHHRHHDTHKQLLDNGKCMSVITVKQQLTRHGVARWLLLVRGSSQAHARNGTCVVLRGRQRRCDCWLHSWRAWSMWVAKGTEGEHLRVRAQYRGAGQQ
jgi:hypothetical protein